MDVDDAGAVDRNNHCDMVSTALFEQFLQLDADERREFVRAAQGALDDAAEVPAAVRSEVERQLAEIGPEPTADYTTLDQFRQGTAERRARRTA